MVLQDDLLVLVFTLLRDTLKGPEQTEVELLVLQDDLVVLVLTLLRDTLKGPEQIGRGVYFYV